MSLDDDPIINKLKALLSEKKLDVALSELASQIEVSLQDISTMIQNRVESYIKVRILQGIIREIEKDKPPREKINVTDLTFPCLRHAYYSMIFREERRARLPELIAIWLGILAHRTKFMSMHEVEVEYEGVYGRVDGYEDGIIFELKTTRNIPNTPYQHHVRQVEYYRLLLEKNEYPVYFAVIVYIDTGSLTMKTFPIFFERTLEEIENELIEKKNKLLEHLQKRVPPPPKPEASWACDYCRFAYHCGYENPEKEEKKS